MHFTWTGQTRRTTHREEDDEEEDEPSRRRRPLLHAVLWGGGTPDIASGDAVKVMVMFGCVFTRFRPLEAVSGPRGRQTICTPLLPAYTPSPSPPSPFLLSSSTYLLLCPTPSLQPPPPQGPNFTITSFGASLRFMPPASRAPHLYAGGRRGSRQHRAGAREKKERER